MFAAARLFPLDFPDLLVDPGVFVPTQGSFLIWKYLPPRGHRSASVAA